MERPTATVPAPIGLRQQRRRLAARRLSEEGLKLIARQGLAAAKVADITAAAGVGKGTFFTHWPSKDAFVADLLDQVLTDLARRVRPLGLAPTDAETLVADVSAVHLRFFQLRPEAAALINQALALDTGGQAHQAAVQRLGAHLDMVAAMIAPAGEQLGWPRKRARELALALMATAGGFFWLGGPLGLGADTPLELLDRLGRALGRGLAR
ncbi:MAG: TetR/AcrR family transcriptional regulator [Proteobacteria bacterium]|nr:TetR/AcrR family transcriptional regulator [Pseudomonadota bacterium]MBU4381414.1 TetR/AcrR family transcriptional regulator [Pseudomonadota bacterium]MBU4605621.1 TetR/AcrR family transcriptional regulator [Pseudomonadota bacterium]MCG2764896.1 TetR/AcrR family transcriptional regulator [Desulfarculaceae bacterium]